MADHFSIADHLTADYIAADIWESVPELDDKQAAAAAEAVVTAGWVDAAPGAVVLQQGDRVLLCLGTEITRDSADDIRESLAEALPGVDIYIAASVSGVLVQRSEEETDG